MVAAPASARLVPEAVDVGCGVDVAVAGLSLASLLEATRSAFALALTNLFPCNLCDRVRHLWPRLSYIPLFVVYPCSLSRGYATLKPPV